ncbi:4'-phosphopantetheinyl transferase superfamily protein [Sulfurimonas sp. MAG313]|nr:4'-phosphopantetheinyl transferase superfamily protein [Sulfurimonas sp. MAG313]MDF1882137.1 4'-phosphopantetheinyl transferase superfamily protein [Sulfurimonas sp. MAG313]
MNPIDIWYFPFDNVEKASIKTLNTQEKQKAERFYKEIDRQRYILSHTFLREVLSNYFPDIKEEAWEFSFNAFGKPSLSSIHECKLYFNLSHSDSRAYIICSKDCECGIDVEEDKDMDLDESILDLVLSVKEKKGFKNKDFFRYWTLKEAYVKAVGKGLSLSINQIEMKSIQKYVHSSYSFDNYMLSFVVLEEDKKHEVRFYTLDDL